ncbi:hypothetical protein V8F20_008558 [Naviculisporaceae sp. PSN 640]
MMPSRLKKLIATFDMNPLLAGLVRSIRYRQGSLEGSANLLSCKNLFERLVMRTQNVSEMQLRMHAGTGGLPFSFDFASAPRIQELVCNRGWLYIDFARAFPQLRVLHLTDGCSVLDPEGDTRRSHETSWEPLPYVEELCIQMGDATINWYQRVLNYFPSLRKLRLGDFKHDPDSYQARYEIIPTLRNLQSRHIALTISRLFATIQAKYPSIEMLHLAELTPVMFGHGVVDYNAPLPLSMIPFPEFPSLTHLTLSSHYLDCGSGGNPFSAACRSCPALRSLRLMEVQIHGLNFCDHLLEFTMDIAKGRQLGRDLAIYLEAVEVFGDWEWILFKHGAAIQYGGKWKRNGDLGMGYKEYWTAISERWAAQPHARILQSLGISYKEKLTWPWEESVQEILV